MSENAMRRMPEAHYTMQQENEIEATYTKIHDDVTISEALDMVAEEATELAKAALKLKRALGYGSPCKDEADTAVDNFCEEYSDVLLTADDVLRRIQPYMPDICGFISHCGAMKKQRYVEQMGGKLPDGVEPRFGIGAKNRCQTSIEHCTGCRFRMLCIMYTDGK